MPTTWTAGVSVQEQIDGIIYQIDIIGKRYRNMHVVINKFLNQFLSEVEVSFTSQQTPSGGQWDELAESTVRDRISKGFPGRQPINRRTKTLYKTAKAGFEKAKSESAGFGEVGVTAVLYEINVPYAGYVNQRRQFIPDTIELAYQLKRVANAYIKEDIGELDSEFTSYDSFYGE